MNWFAIAGGIFIAIICISALLAPYVSTYPFDAQDTSRVLEGPSFSHPMGTDSLGRDLFSRLIYGARVSMAVGVSTAIIALVIGTLYGAISGYIGGKIDNWMMRIVDVMYALPDLLLIILVSVVIGRGFIGILLALSIVSWVSVARLIRGEVLRLREQGYVEAAKALGATHKRIVFRHILPSTFGILIVTLTLRIPATILAESTLSFIGLGPPPPFSSWGTLANEGWTALRFYPYLIVFPGTAIFLTILSFNFFGDWLRDALE